MASELRSASVRDALLELLKPRPAEGKRSYPIGARVGNAKNDDAALLESLGHPIA